MHIDTYTYLLDIFICTCKIYIQKTTEYNNSINILPFIILVIVIIVVFVVIVDIIVFVVFSPVSAKSQFSFDVGFNSEKTKQKQ